MAPDNRYYAVALWRRGLEEPITQSQHSIDEEAIKNAKRQMLRDQTIIKAQVNYLSANSKSKKTLAELTRNSKGEIVITRLLKDKVKEKDDNLGVS